MSTPQELLTNIFNKLKKENPKPSDVKNIERKMEKEKFLKEELMHKIFRNAPHIFDTCTKKELKIIIDKYAKQVLELRCLLHQKDQEIEQLKKVNDLLMDLVKGIGRGLDVLRNDTSIQI